MADSAVRSSLTGAAHLQTLVLDLLDMLVKASREKIEIQKENEFRKAVCDMETPAAYRNAGIQMYTLQSSINGKVIKKMNQAGIPYADYNVEHSTQSVILIPAKYKEMMDRIIADVKLQLGYTLDNKAELDAALVLQGKSIHPIEQEIAGLDGALAEKVMYFAEKHRVTAVMEKQESGTYSIYSSKEDAEKMNRFLFAAAWNLTGTGGRAEKLRCDYASTEREEINHALERADEKMSNAYIFSATKPDCYLHIEEDAFTFYRNNVPVVTARMQDNSDDYSELLKLQCKSIDSPVYMLQEEVKAKGGPSSENIKKEVTASLYKDVLGKEELEIVAAEKMLRNFLEKKYAISDAHSVRDAADSLLIDGLGAFRDHMLNRIKEDPQREGYYRKVLRLCEISGNSHMEQASSMLAKAEVKDIIIKRNPIISMDVYQQTVERKEYEHKQDERNAEKKEEPFKEGLK